ncbi:MAG: hypothetical protein KDD99_32880, partial [Bacteroidetes bacterium]|nr:hypothetical protein [Bacteroidota bacterium]
MEKIPFIAPFFKAARKRESKKAVKHMHISPSSYFPIPLVPPYPFPAYTAVRFPGRLPFVSHQ